MVWPKQVCNYRIGALLGTGNYGEVRLAEHIRTKRRYAVKILPRNYLDFDEYSIDVRREMSILMAMQHPNIIRLQEVCMRNAQLFLVMELATDGDLFDLINDSGPLSEWRARDYFIQLVNAVSYCHKRGVYHRDLKPENILLTEDLQKLKLADFGFAAVIDKYSSIHPLLRTNCGSPHYCAPEVWNGEQKQGYVGSKADAFSCGVILYCMLVGVQPFFDSCEDIVLAKVNKCEFEIPASVPHLARDLIESLLRRNPEERSSLRKAKDHPWLANGHLSLHKPLADVNSKDYDGSLVSTEEQTRPQFCSSVINGKASCHVRPSVLLDTAPPTRKHIGRKL